VAAEESEEEESGEDEESSDDSIEEETKRAPAFKSRPQPSEIRRTNPIQTPTPNRINPPYPQLRPTQQQRKVSIQPRAPAFIAMTSDGFADVQLAYEEAKRNQRP
jgi:hypothetical protein